MDRRLHRARRADLAAREGFGRLVVDLARERVVCTPWSLLAGELVPGFQWHVLQIPRVLPPPVRDLILSKVVGPEAAAAGETIS